MHLYSYKYIYEIAMLFAFVEEETFTVIVMLEEEALKLLAMGKVVLRLIM